MMAAAQPQFRARPGPDARAKHQHAARLTPLRSIPALTLPRNHAKALKCLPKPRSAKAHRPLDLDQPQARANGSSRLPHRCKHPSTACSSQHRRPAHQAAGHRPQAPAARGVALLITMKRRHSKQQQAAVVQMHHHSSTQSIDSSG